MLLLELAPEILKIPLVQTIVGIAICVIILFFLIFLIKKVMSRKDKQLRKTTLKNKVYESQKAELEWCREKRLLMERQTQEKHLRIIELIKAQSPEKSHRLSYPASQMFLMTESIREERQYLGTDLSKIGLIEKTLEEIGHSLDDDVDEIEQCRQSLNKYREQLRNSQSLLRNVFSEAEQIEKKARCNEISFADIPDVVEQLKSFKKQLNFLPDELQKIAQKASEEVLPIFEKLTSSIDDQQLHQAWREQLNIDLLSSQNRLYGKSELITANQNCIDAFEHLVEVEADLKASILEPVNEIEPEPSLEPLVIEQQVFTDEAADTTDPFSSYFQTEQSEPTQSNEEQGQTFLFGNDEENDSVKIEKKPEKKLEGGYQFKGKSVASSTNEAKKLGSTSSNDGYTFGSSKPGPLAEKENSFKDELIEQPPTNDETDNLWEQPDFGLNDIQMFEPEASDQEPQIIDRPPEENPFNPFAAKTEEPEPVVEKIQNSLVIFRSDTPELWNTKSELENDQFSVQISDIQGNFNWMGIKRLDTNEEVFCEISVHELKDDGDGKAAGFNGSNEFFYGARHLGFFSEQCATEVETRFTYGGWGFGHLVSSDNHEEPEQVCGWNGKQIDRDTVFEFTLYEGRPEQASEEQVIM